MALRRFRRATGSGPRLIGGESEGHRVRIAGNNLAAGAPPARRRDRIGIDAPIGVV